MALALLATSCGSSAGPNHGSVLNSAIAHVIAIDAEIGAVRNQAPRDKPLDIVVREYSDALRAIDRSRTPLDFSSAWIAHIEAWEALIPYLKEHSELRGEMHALFERLLSVANPTASEFQRLQAAVWSTWATIEEIQARDARRIREPGRGEGAQFFPDRGE